MIGKILLLSLLTVAECVASTVDVYDFTAKLKVPRVYDNTMSTGYRKYQWQTIKGKMLVSFGGEEFGCSMSFIDCYNKTHKVNGVNVTYEVEVNDDVSYHRWNVIGHNGNLNFTTPSISFALKMEPSYAIGEPHEDNSLYLMLSGTGKCMDYQGASVTKYVKGNVAGTIGCGCADYGHTSPTRMMGECGYTSFVDDVCGVFGTFILKYNKTQSCRGFCVLCR